jgi:hypothetical protein
MGKASRSKQDEYGRREKIAAQRQAARRAEQRRNGLLIAGGAVIVVIAVVVAFVVVKANKSSNAPTTAGVSGAPTGTSLTSVINTITTVPTSATDAIGSGGGTVTGKPGTISGTPLTSDGKPEVLYVGAEYCPYCAAERWGIVVALSRFGTFTGLEPMRSISSDVYPNTATWTFVHAKYTSNYIQFSPVELYTNYLTNNNYTPLQTMTSAQSAIFTKYSDNGAYPFVDFGNKYAITEASYDPQLLAGLSWSQIASDVSSGSGQVAQAIGGTANYMTAALCKLTGNQPSTACTSTVQSLEGSI